MPTTKWKLWDSWRGRVSISLKWQGKTSVLGAKPVSVPLHPRQIPHCLTLDWIRASVVRDQGRTFRSASELGYWQLLSLSLTLRCSNSLMLYGWWVMSWKVLGRRRRVPTRTEEKRGKPDKWMRLPVPRQRCETCAFGVRSLSGDCR